MISSHIDIEVEDSQVIFLMMAVRRAISAPSIAAFLENRMVRRIQEQAKGRFDKEVDPEGTPWAPLRHATNEIRMALGFPPVTPINRRTGAMERYITGSAGRASGNSMEVLLTYPGTPPTTREMGKKVATAQMGWRDASGTAVPRPVLGWESTDLAWGVHQLEAWIVARVANPSVGAGASL